MSCSTSTPRDLLIAHPWFSWAVNRGVTARSALRRDARFTSCPLPKPVPPFPNPGRQESAASPRWRNFTAELGVLAGRKPLGSKRCAIIQSFLSYMSTIGHTRMINFSAAYHSGYSKHGFADCHTNTAEIVARIFLGLPPEHPRIIPRFSALYARLMNS